MRTRTGKHATGRCPNTSPSRSPLPFTCVGSSPPCAAEGRPFTICVWRGGIKGRYFKARKHQRKSGYAHVELWVGRPIYRQKCFLDSFSTMPFVFALVCSGGVGTQHHRRSSGQVHGRGRRRTLNALNWIRGGTRMESGRASDASKHGCFQGLCVTSSKFCVRKIRRQQEYCLNSSVYQRQCKIGK